MEACDYKAHAVCIPCPFQTHIMPMFKLAKLLHHRGVHITFVNTEFNHRRFLKSSRSAHDQDDDGDDESLKNINGLPSSFRFETITDGLAAPSDENANQDTKSIWQSIQNYAMFQPFLDLLAKLNDSSNANNNDNPPFTCIISEAFMPFTVKAAQQLGLPVAVFIPIAATNFKHFIHALAPQKDDESYPTKENHDMHKNCFRPTDIKDIMSQLAKEAAENVSKASAVLIHSFDALEQAALDDISSSSSRVPHLFTVGPLQLLLDHSQEQDRLLNTIDYNISWKKETECLQWLDSQQSNSVIYVSFGGSGLLSKQQLIEVGMGLANSNHPFLWVIRPGLVTGDTRVLPSEFEAKAKEKGFIASWCPQEQVLNHPSVGGFFTHCGWNSIMESLSGGVPMICWPFIADQPANCRYICKEWGVGMEINNGEEVNRENIEKLVRELMWGDMGKQMRNKAMEWKRLAEDAASPHGSSSRNLEKLVSKILFTKHI